MDRRWLYFKSKLKGVGKKRLIFKFYQELSRHGYRRQECPDENKYVGEFKDSKFNDHKYNLKLNYETG